MGLFRNDAPVLIYILHSGNLYGTERMALATMEGMDEYATRVVVAPRPGGSASVTVAAASAGFETVNFLTRKQLLRGLLPYFLKNRVIDVIGVGVGSSLMCHALAKLLRVRLRQLQVAHGGTADWCAYGRKHLLNKIPIGMVAVSDFVKQKLLDHNVRPESICVIDNFLSHSQRLEYSQRAAYDTALPGARPVDPERLRVAIVSRVDAIKRLDVMVDAIERHGLGQFQFDVYGTGEQFALMRERTASMDNITFHGFASDVKDRLKNADLLLHLCPDEPFGLVILEAFLSRLVAAVPDTGGAGSIVQDGVTGLHFKANDADDLTRVLHVARTSSAQALQRLADTAAEVLDQRFAQAEGIRRYRRALEDAGGTRALRRRRLAVG